MKRINLYTTANDIVSIFDDCKNNLVYVIAEQSTNDGPNYISLDPQRLEEVAQARSDKLCLAIMSSGKAIRSRRIDRDNCQTVYVIDMLANPDAIELTFGALKNGVISSSMLAYAGSDPEQTNVFKTLQRSVQRKCSKHNAYYVGMDAERKARSGVRLALSQNSAREYDLHL